ncbi:MAG: hypothetical protein AMXMBFR47_31450 [Planctomycetota bacterium]
MKIRSIGLVALGLGLLPDALGQLDFTLNTMLADGMWNNPTSIAVDSAGVIHVAFMTQFDTDSNTKEIWYASDAGGEWTFEQITDNAVREEFPSLTLDAAENVHIAFHTGVTTSNKIRYTNNVAVAFIEPIDITGSGFVIVEHAVDSAGNVHFAFQDQISGTSITDVYYRMWSPTTGLGPLLNLSNTPTTRELQADIAVDSLDVVHVVFRGGSISSGPLTYMNNSTGSFVSLPTGVAVADDPLIEIDEADRITIVYEAGDALYLIESLPGGGFTSPLLLTTAPGLYRPAFMDKFAIDADGRRHIAFVSNVNTQGAFVISEGQSGFSPPQLIENPTGSKVGTSIAVNAAGRMALTYQFGYVVDDIVQADIRLGTAQLGGGCTGDLDGDGDVDLPDLATLLSNFGRSGDAGPADGDTDGDLDVDLADLATLLSNFGSACP